jgi:ribosomal protein L11 methyltransferase
VPADATGFGADALRLADSGAFGTGLHPTTALCLELLDELLREAVPPRLLDVGTGSGVLALAALRLGVPHVHALDIDADALRAAGENARLNGLQDCVSFQAGGPDALDDAWPFIVANILAAPLIDMAPTLVRRVASGGHLLLSGVPADMAREVERVYCRLGMRPARIETRAGWSALVAQPSW